MDDEVEVPNKAVDVAGGEPEEAGIGNKPHTCCPPLGESVARLWELSSSAK